MYSGQPVDLSDRIKNVCSPLVKHPEKLQVSLTGEAARNQTYLIRCDREDMGKLLGRHGMISDSLRTLVNIALRPYRRKASLKFESLQTD